MCAVRVTQYLCAVPEARRTYFRVFSIISECLRAGEPAAEMISGRIQKADRAGSEISRRGGGSRETRKKTRIG